MQSHEHGLDAIVSLAKRRGFIFQGSEIYGGLAGTWDYGPLGVTLKNNIKTLWWRMFVDERDDMYGVDAAILMNAKAWEASGHVAGFSDPLVECLKCKRRHRADQVGDACPECDGKLGEARQFNMMLQTKLGATDDAAAATYLRPETAGGMFVNFKNVVDAFHPKLPFGLAQIGKAFRNEIAPRDFLFRAREFEQMEAEYFVRPALWREAFEEWRGIMRRFIERAGIDANKVHEVEIPDSERAHYSARTIDAEFDYPFGRKELYGLAYRADFDLSSHAAASGVDLSYYDEEGGGRFVPHVVEPSFGLDRIVLAVLLSAYREDEMSGEKRAYLAFKPAVAPIKAAVFPLLRNKPELVAKARAIYTEIKTHVPQVVFDDNGNIGKRYRRQDEIGTPWCVTIDFDTLENGAVTLRERDTGEQTRIASADLPGTLAKRLKE